MGSSYLTDKDFGWKRMMDSVKAFSKDAYVKVGILGDSSRGGLHVTGPDGKASELTVAEIALVNEYGSKDGRIPSRPAFRSTFDRMKKTLEDDASKLLMRVVLDGMPLIKALDILGNKLAVEIKKTITAGPEVPPENADSTRRIKEAKKGARRWGIRTLVDKGREVGAIASAVVIDDKQEDPKYITKR